MRGVALWFFVSAAIYVTLGMLLGIAMSASQDHAMAPVHAHLNLIGWASMGLMGLYYHAVPSAAESRLAWTHFGITTLAVWLMIPGIALALRQITEVMAIAGSMLALLSMLLFIYIVVTTRTKDTLARSAIVSATA